MAVLLNFHQKILPQRYVPRSEVLRLFLLFSVKNLFPLYPDYTSVESFVEDVQGYVDKGYLSAAKELYTQIRMKPRDAVNVLESLREDGIKYLEIRTIDLNVYDPCGIAKIDMEFYLV